MVGGLEAAALSLGAAVVKSAAKLWLGDREILANASGSAVDLITGRVSGAIEQRRIRRVFDQLEEIAAQRLDPIMDRELASLPDNERAAAHDAVRRTLDEAALTDDDLLAADLDAGYLDREMRRTTSDLLTGYVLSDAARGYYDRLLRESCSMVVQIVTTLPQFKTGVLTELLRRETELLDLVRTVLGKLPDRRDASDFEADYRQQVVGVLDRMRFLGARLSEPPSRRYPLTVAYLSLTMSAENRQDRRVEEVLADRSRLLIHGEAGMGKTTLLQWIAVRCALRDMPPGGAESHSPPGSGSTSWNDVLPLFVPLRRYTEGPLPTPEQFLGYVGRHISEEMPEGWVQQHLRAGSAVVLVDGVDELRPRQREAARDWLEELTLAFPDARFVVTSRPAAVPEDWLRDQGFTTAELQPMTLQDVRTFVRRWYDAMRAQSAEYEERATLDHYERQLLDEIAARGPLRRIAENPLLCALLCALHREQRGQLQDRMTLYRTALDMLVNRDQDRGLETRFDLHTTEKLLLLQDLAYWLVKNGESDAEMSRVRERVRARIDTLNKINAGAEEVLRYLLERTGLLRQPVTGRVDFVHRTFQEYLAAKAAVDSDDIGLLLEHAELDQWREVIVMAAGEARRDQADRLLRGLIRPGFRKRQLQDYFDLLAVACLENSPELDPRLRDEVQRRARRFIPPRTDATVHALSAAGEFVIDLLAQAEPTATEAEAGELIYTAARIGGDQALQFLTRFRADPRPVVAAELVAGWTHFDVEEYARLVLPDVQLPGGRLEITERDLIAGLRYLRNLRDLTIRCPGEPVDLTPVAGLTSLTALRVESASGNGRELEGLTGLRSLWMNAYGGSITAVPRLPDLLDFGLANVRMPTLELGLANVRGVNDLPALSFLRHPVRLELRTWPYLDDVTPLQRWWDSLEELVLADMRSVELARLDQLTALRRLELSAWHGQPVKLTFLPKLVNLEELDLSGHSSLPALGPVRHLPNLRRLRLLGYRSQLDLSMLAGTERLEVLVSPGTPVVGGDLLGSGSSVVHVPPGPGRIRRSGSLPDQESTR